MRYGGWEGFEGGGLVRYGGWEGFKGGGAGEIWWGEVFEGGGLLGGGIRRWGAGEK